MRVGILKNEDPYSHIRWEEAAKNAGVEYFIIDITTEDWLEKINNEKFDILLMRPPGLTSQFKELYDERSYILSEVLEYPIYPTLNEIKVYENKRFLSYYLKARNIPHPATRVFYNKEEALQFAASTSYPVVGKLNIGAAGNGIRIIKSRDEMQNYLEKAFSTEGLVARSGPKLGKVPLKKRILRLLTDPMYYVHKTKGYKNIRNDAQRNFVIFQEYIEHDFEWRVVSIGGSYFAHKKLKKGELASSSLLKDYSTPPSDLIYFVKDIMEKNNFQSQAVDVFETRDGRFLVNEMQSFFGQSDKFQMKVDDKIGRYIFKDDKLLFEEGDFNTTECYDLRMKHVLEIIKNKQTV